MDGDSDPSSNKQMQIDLEEPLVDEVWNKGISYVFLSEVDPLFTSD